MAWLNNANTIATLVLAIFGIIGYIFGIATYLGRRANPVKQDTSTTPASQPQKTIPSRPISWLEWIELFTQGLVDTADFVINFFPLEVDMTKQPAINKVGFCAAICAFGIIFGEIIIGFAIGIFLSLMGVNNPTGAAVGITTILLFMTFSLVYIYHVGLLVERKRREQYEEIQRQLSEAINNPYHINNPYRI